MWVAGMFSVYSYTWSQLQYNKHYAMIFCELCTISFTYCNNFLAIIVNIYFYPELHLSPFRENLNVTLLARLEVSENYSSAVVSDYVYQFSSSVEIVGAVLVSNGTCYLNQPFIAMNISTREPKQIGHQYLHMYIS